MSEQQSQTANDSRRRPFPWHCPKCRRREVRPAIVPYHCEMAHDGRLYAVEVPALTVPRCSHCGELVFNDLADEQVRQALHAQLCLLAPKDFRAARTKSGLTDC